MGSILSIWVVAHKHLQRLFQGIPHSLPTSVGLQSGEVYKHIGNPVDIKKSIDLPHNPHWSIQERSENETHGHFDGNLVRQSCKISTFLELTNS